MSPSDLLAGARVAATGGRGDELLVAKGVEKRYPGTRRTDPEVRALDGVDLALHQGEILALVGGSGSGKSTLMSLIAGLQVPTAGSVELWGAPVHEMTARAQSALRRRVQMVFQDPYESLDPRHTIEQIVAEPLVVHRIETERTARREKVIAALREVGLAPAEHFLPRRPGELSGGQRQRVAIATALVTDPDIVLADEPISMLDVSVRAEILNLLSRLRDTRGVAVLMVTHDLPTAAAVADRIAVMQNGKLVEVGETRQVVHSPQHEYTRALLAASPSPDPRRRADRQRAHREPQIAKTRT